MNQLINENTDNINKECTLAPYKVKANKQKIYNNNDNNKNKSMKLDESYNETPVYQKLYEVKTFLLKKFIYNYHHYFYSDAKR